MVNWSALLRNRGATLWVLDWQVARNSYSSQPHQPLRWPLMTVKYHMSRSVFSVSCWSLPIMHSIPPGVQQDEVPSSIPLGAQYHTLAHGVNLGKSGRPDRLWCLWCLNPPPFHPQLHIHGIWLVVSFNHLEKWWSSSIGRMTSHSYYGT